MLNEISLINACQNNTFYLIIIPQKTHFYLKNRLWQMYAIVIMLGANSSISVYVKIVILFHLISQ